MKTLAAAKFKAACLAVIDEVEVKREPVVITKNGRPVARLGPVEIAEDEDPLAVFRFGKGRIVGDVVTAMTAPEEWNDPS